LSREELDIFLAGWSLDEAGEIFYWYGQEFAFTQNTTVDEMGIHPEVINAWFRFEVIPKLEDTVFVEWSFKYLNGMTVKRLANNARLSKYHHKRYVLCAKATSTQFRKERARVFNSRLSTLKKRGEVVRNMAAFMARQYQFSENEAARQRKDELVPHGIAIHFHPTGPLIYDPAKRVSRPFNLIDLQSCVSLVESIYSFSMKVSCKRRK
jgi:hypothetical protein